MMPVSMEPVQSASIEENDIWALKRSKKKKEIRRGRWMERKKKNSFSYREKISETVMGTFPVFASSPARVLDYSL